MNGGSNAWRGALERELGADAFTADGDAVEVAPDSIDGVVAALAIAREHRLTVRPRGLGSKDAWSSTTCADLRLATRRLTGIVSYEPGDGTVCARAGTTMESLSATVREGGHHLTPDVPRPGSATLGGVVGAAQSGVDRLRYGPVRNALLGVRAVLADGSVTKSGGQLVKNVTGYDLHRLYCGAHGSLCVIVEASLRLHPLPQERAVLRWVAGDRDEALSLARSALDVRARHVAVWCTDSDEGAWTTSVAIGGRREVVDHESKLLREALDQPEAVLASGSAESALREARDSVLDARGAWPHLELATKRTDLGPVLARVDAVASELGTRARVVAHPGVAQAFVRIEGYAEGHAEAWSAGLAKLPGRARWRRHDLTAPSLSTPTKPAVSMMRALQRSLDEGALFEKGLLPGGV